jgi:hypothetical protein
MKSLLKKLVAFKESNDIHRATFTWSYRLHRGLHKYFSDFSGDMHAAVYDIVGENFKFVKSTTLVPYAYIETFDVLTGEDAVMLKLMMPTYYQMTAFKIIKPEIFPKEYCKRYQSTIQSHFKQKRKGPK